MAGIQISGLLSNSAFDWKSVVDQLIAIDSTPITNLQNEQTTNSNQASALVDVKNALQTLQDSVNGLLSGNPFENRVVSSSNSSSTWKSNSAAGSTVGSYAFDVTQLATAAQLDGSTDIGAGVSSSTDVSGVTLSSMNTAAAVTDGFFTVNGQQITISSTDSLQSVFDMISTATGGAVTAGYDPGTDGVSLTDTSGAITLGAGNDTSNFLQVMKLSNNGTGTITSSAQLGTVELGATLANSKLRTAITAVDGSGNGSFAVNGVTINYNVNTDTLSSILSKITTSTAGVTATYDAVKDELVLTNKSTGNIGLGVSEAAGGLLGALGLTSGTTTLAGSDAHYTVNGGQTLTSTSNTLDSTSHGITGLSVTVNSTGTETLSVNSDTSSMQSAIQGFLDKFNAAQDVINNDTAITVNGSKVTTSVLSGNHDVQDWGSELQNLAFASVTGVTGSVTSLSNLGIDFDGTTGHLIIKDSDALNAALSDHPDDVQSFFLTANTGLVSVMNNKLTGQMSTDDSLQSDLNQANSAIDDQISTLQTRLDQERTDLTNSFVQMLDAQSSAQTQSQALTNQFFSSSSCWVARAVYGETNPRWLLFRHWLLVHAPSWFRALYLRHGERFAGWVADKPLLKVAIRRWMDTRVATLWSR